MATQRRSGAINIGAGSLNLGVSSGGGSTTPTISVDDKIVTASKGEVYNPTPGTESSEPQIETTIERPIRSEEEKSEQVNKLDSLLAESEQLITNEKNSQTFLNQEYSTAITNGDYDQATKLSLLIGQSQQRIDNANLAHAKAIKAVAEAEDEGWWDDALETTKDVVKYLAGGALVYEGLSEIFDWDDDDYQQIDPSTALEESTKAITNANVADQLIDASYRDQPRLTDLENLGNYRNQFGSLAGDFFNDPQMGEALQSAYAQAKLIDPNLSADQFLVEYADQNPTDAIAQRIRYATSKTGQLERSSNSLFDIDRNITMRGMDTARKFYQSTQEGGYGFSPDQFRTSEQKQIVNSAMGLGRDPNRDMLKKRISSRVQSNGRMSDDEVRDISSRAMTSVDPSLQNQAYIRNGGLGRSVLNTGQAMRQRMVQDEGALLGIMADERAGLTTANNIVNQNTLDPVRALGLEGSNISTATNLYNTNPTTGLNYDPTSQFFSSIIGNNQNTANANSASASTSSSLNKTLEGLEGISG